MHRMAQHLRYFIAKRVAEEASWQNIEIIFSGPDVPGEGEHKIMEYIRCAKAEPDYYPNLRHCLYGLDADLILLGLLSHEPHFALLREEVLFGPASRKPRTLAQTRFFLMHLGLLRDYLDEEFRSYYASLDPATEGLPMDYAKAPFPHYSVERIIDDFILMTVFVGNDFLPGLPYLHIGENAIGIMFDAYKKVLYASGGNFMNNAGKIDFAQAALFLQELCYIEHDHFERSGAAIKVKHANASRTISAAHKELYELIKKELIMNESCDSWSQDEESSPCTGKNKTFLWKLATDFGLTFNLDENRKLTLSKGWNNDDASQSDDGKFIVDQVQLDKYESMVLEGKAAPVDVDLEDEFKKWKAEFYKEKLHLDTRNDPASLGPLLNSYMTGIQWNMFYYYKGIVDWAWYYPFHYGPYLTDVAEAMKSFECQPFEMGKPYAPLEQLLAVLPAGSAAHVPVPFADLMTSPYSPIIDFYPKDFEQDLNGKKSPWEAIVLIPFIDEDRLLASVETVLDQLNDDEKERNQYGSSTLFTHSGGETLQLAAPPRSRYTQLNGVPVSMVPYDLPVLETDLSFKPELLPGVKPLAGFPTLKNLPHRAHIDTVGIALFGGKPTNSTSLVLTVAEVSQFYAGKIVEAIAKELCGKRIYAAWPFLHEGIVVRLTDALFSYDATSKKPLDEPELRDQSRVVIGMLEEHRKMMAVELGDVEVVIWLAPLTGMRRESDGSTRKAFAQAALPYPLQAVLPPEACIEDPRYLELAAKTVEQEYPVSSMAVYAGPEHFGALVRVTGHHNGGIDLAIERRMPLAPEPSFPHKLAMDALHSEKYLPARTVADMLGLPQLFLSKITSGWYLFFGNDMDKSSNVGLGLKFEGRGQRAVGYAKKGPTGWEFSQQAFQLIKDYRTAFPQLFAALLAKVNSQQTQAVDIFGPECSAKGALQAKMEPIRTWLKSRTETLRQVPIDTVLLDPVDVQAINAAWNTYKAAHRDIKTVELTGVSARLLRHEGMAQFIASAANSGEGGFSVGDRVRYVGSGAAGIPFGVSGIVIGLDGMSSGSQALAHILLDEPIIGVGKTLGGLCPQNHGISVSRRYLVNLNRGQVGSKSGLSPQYASKPAFVKPSEKPFVRPAEKTFVRPVENQMAQLAISANRPPAHRAPLSVTSALPQPSMQAQPMPSNLSALFSAAAAKQAHTQPAVPKQHVKIRPQSNSVANTGHGAPKITIYSRQMAANQVPPTNVAPTSAAAKANAVPPSTAAAPVKPDTNIVYSTKKGLLKPDLSWSK